MGAHVEGPRALVESGIMTAGTSGAGVSVDGKVITAGTADDLPAFFRALDAALNGKA
jgi:hypothetical protein